MSDNLPRRQIDEREFKKMNRRKLLTWAVLSAAGFAGIRAIDASEVDMELPWPLRSVNRLTDQFWNSVFRNNARAPETPPATGRVRVNGYVGMNASVPADWKLQINSPGLASPLFMSLDEIKALPAVTESFEFKCIEGWSENVTARGVKFSDFAKHLSEKDEISKYAFALLATINGGYYVSMDMRSLMHSQTLLCYEMNGRTLLLENGYPLRLITPVKYGVKNIKQLGSIDFGHSPPADYWAELGYGEHLGL
ncbi:molybdopterin-dependent oxidoreductase [Bdellovibrio sp. SKB1291214]|uniref:molybdopterin-dependent oxidoreductase n=1 Tax=Bdellovibrio sp. SKB1291214 TaxID=1732569 RepID=UPI000B51B304|nr:molybdopterin-dependent oxidoreductase [Bdellovibrio sp. SKB1291214]UYL07347.1 molybdopterin-dependent oxidoreductase [Bdellovibrio sp. SKB1291214]